MQRHDTQSGIGAQHEEAVNLDDDPARPDSIIPIIRRIGPSRRSTTTRFNEEVAISIPRFSTSVPRSSDKPRRSSGDSTSSQRSGRRNPVVVASTGASRRRPAVLPRRSSGTSSLGNSRTSSYSKLARSPKFSATNASVGARQGAEAQATRRARAVSPHPSKQRRRLSPGPPSHDKDSGDESEKDIEAQNGQAASELSEETSEASEDDEAPADKPLIDPNFRSKFVDKTLSSQRSVTNLPAFAQKSSAAVATAAYFQATGLMGSGQPKSSAGRGKGREAFTNVTAALKAPASAGPEAAGDDNPRSLTKTKSQLTLLLEKEKALSSDQEQTFKKPDKP